MTDKKIYIVTSGSYSDYRIEGVFDDKLLCDKFVNRHDLQVEDHVLNPCAERIAEGLTHFCVRVGQKTGEIIDVFKQVTTDEMQVVFRVSHCIRGDARLIVKCWARDEEHAIKIATEKKQEVDATGGWERKE